MIAVSACLLGICCRYDGKAQPNKELKELFERGEALPVCPECLGGLTVPRNPCEIRGGDGFDVIDGQAIVAANDGRDVTHEFVLGAEKTVMLLKENGITECVLKSRSPSCGVGIIYDGTFSGKGIEGNGVTAAMLIKHGIRVRAAEADE